MTAENEIIGERTKEDGGTEISGTVRHIRRTNVLMESCGWTTRQFVRLATPALIVSLPLAMVLLLAALPLVGGAGVLVDGEFVLATSFSGPLPVWVAVMLVGSALSQAVVLPATVIMAAGAMLGRPVSPSTALRAALRRAPATLVAGAILLLEWAAITAIGVWMASGTQALWWPILVMVVLAWAAIPGLLAVPALILEGRTAWRAIGRGYRLATDRRIRAGLRLLIGLLAVPALAQQGLVRLLTLVPEAAVAAVTGVALTTLGVLTTVFQAVVLARMFLFLLAHHDKEPAPALEGIVRLLPDGPPAPARPVRALAALLLPGLLYGGIVLVNPLGWARVTETNVIEDWVLDGTQSARQQEMVRPPESGGIWLPLSHSSLVSLHPGTGRGPVMVTDDRTTHPALIRCADAACRDTSYWWAEQERNGATDPIEAGTQLSDGRLILTLWQRAGGRTLDDDFELTLVSCDQDDCEPATEARPPLAPITGSPSRTTTALAARPDGGLNLAQAREESSGKATTVSFTLCDNPACSRPVRTTPATLDGFGARSNRSLAVAAGPDGRPVAALLDDRSGALSLISCTDSVCSSPRVTTPVRGRPSDRHPYYAPELSGLSMAVRADGRPVIAYRDEWDGSIGLLDCRTTDCAKVDEVTLTGPGLGRARPALVLDKAGRALVAYQDPGERRIVLASCTGTRCATTGVGRIRYGLGAGLSMTLGRQGRPMIAWADHRDSRWAFNVTTVLDTGLLTGP